MVKESLIRGFIRSYTGRMLLGALLIHVLLVPVLFMGVLHTLEQDYEAQFVNYARSQSRLLAMQLGQNPEPARIRIMLDELLLGGEIIYADYLSPSGRIVPSAPIPDDGFKEDFFFGGHGDHVYFVVIPVRNDDQKMNGALRLGFDERLVEDHISNLYRRGVYLAGGYVVLSFLFIGFFGHLLTHSIRQLRDASRKIANGNTDERLSVKTSVTEVSSLAQDLEYMREELLRREHEITLREAYQRAVLETAAEGIITVDSSGNIESFNKAAELIFGYDMDEVLGTPFMRMLQPPDVRKFIRDNGELLIYTGLELNGISKSGEVLDLRLSVSETAVAGTRSFTIMVQDISERHTFESKLAYMATHDALTGLPNRTLFNDRLEQALAHASRNDRLVALMFLDLDRFKNINDTLGHDIGDLLLKAVAERLKACVRADDTLARLGGDELTLIMDDLDHVDSATIVAQKILFALEQPFHLAGHEIFISGSIGITFYPFDDIEAGELVKNADTAMYSAKNLGGNNFQFYTAKMNAMVRSQLDMETRLRYALERNELFLHYQPQIDLESGRILSVEALLRWQNPELGLVPPAQFIPIAEDTGLILPISEWVLRAACAQAVAWQKAGLGMICVAVNLSARQFAQPDLVEMINSILDETGLEACDLDLELTESMVMHSTERTITTMHQLKRLGVLISIDDFGTGYSSLSYLKRFPIDILKIDRSFVRDITINPDDAAIASAIIAMAHNLKLKVIAEGVETAEQLVFLRDHRCSAVQGYYFSEPLPPEDVARLLRDSWRFTDILESI